VRDLGVVGGRVQGGSWVGGLAGENHGTILNSYSTATVIGNNQGAGGLVGYNMGLIESSRAGGQVSAPSTVGGLVGSMSYSAAVVRNSYATGAVKGGASVGGLVGEISQYASIYRSYATGAVTATGDDAGGLVGRGALSAIDFSYATGAVSGLESVGGLVGDAIGLRISQSYATGAVSGTNYVGGLAGIATGPIAYAYALGSVTGQDYVGGLVGYSNSSINNAYAAGLVRGTGRVGAVAGWASGDYMSLYFDRESTGQNVGFGSGNASVLPFALNSRDARADSSYRGWDMGSVWYQTGDMRPILRSEAAPAVDGVTTISNLHQLALIATNLGGNYVLAHDINASATAGSLTSSGIWGPTGWRPLGPDNSVPFYGALDGAGHVISGLQINGGYSFYTGLFGASFGTIRNLGLVGGQLTGGTNAGALAGLSTGTISNVYSTMPVSGGTIVGGLVGITHGGSISSAYASGAVAGWAGVGGLIGWSQDTIIRNVYSTGSVTATGQAGGLIGIVDADSRISFAYASGAVNVAQTSSAGGFIGEWRGGTITGSFYNSTTTGMSRDIGQGTGNALGLTTAEFQDTASFYALASAQGWDFKSVWAPSSAGFHPELYALSRVVTVQATDVAFTYGNALPGLSVSTYGGSAQYVFGKTDDRLSIDATASTSAGATSGVGTYGSSVNAPGTVVSSQGLTYRVVSLAGLVRVNPRQITVSADNASHTYGDANSGFGYSITAGNLVNGDTFSGTLATSATAASGVGSYTIDLGSLAASSNYALTYVPGTLTISPRALTVSADSFVRGYGDANPTLTYAIMAGSLANGDALSGALAAAATSASGVGSYAITQGNLVASANYALTFVGGSMLVMPRAISVTANSGSMVYGDAPGTFTYAVTSGGMVNGDLLTGELASSATSTSGVGSYAITQGSLSASANYALTFVDGTMQVTPRSITVSAGDRSVVYGNGVPALGYTITAGGLVNGDVLTGVLASVVHDRSDVGRYAVTRGSLAASANYALVFNSGTVTVTPRAISLAANDQTRLYGISNGDLTYRFLSGDLVGGDTFSGALGTSAIASSAPGSYDILRGTLQLSQNYSLSVQAGRLTITAPATTSSAGMFVQSSTNSDWRIPAAQQQGFRAGSYAVADPRLATAFCLVGSATPVSCGN
jgi:hypothetical protein